MVLIYRNGCDIIDNSVTNMNKYIVISLYLCSLNI
jgi:hypothetical protein